MYILVYGTEGSVAYRDIAEAFFLLGVAAFLVIFTLWGLRGLLHHDVSLSLSHWHNLTRMSFTALIPIIGFIANYQALYFFGISAETARLSLVNFYLDYGVAFSLGVVVGYRLYTKEIHPREINYAIVIPPLSVGTSLFLATPLLGYYGASQGAIIAFLTLTGFGVFFMLYLVIGSLALSGHVTTKSHETLPTTMLPVGVASLTILNLFAVPSFGTYLHVSLSLQTIYLLSILLWGFEVWNFLVVVLIIVTHSSWGSLGVWAYGFPLGLFATSTLRLSQYSGLGPLVDAFWVSVAAINLLWVLALVNTALFLRAKARDMAIPLPDSPREPRGHG